MFKRGINCVISKKAKSLDAEFQKVLYGHNIQTVNNLIIEHITYEISVSLNLENNNEGSIQCYRLLG